MPKLIVTIEVTSKDEEHVVEMLGNCMSRILYNHPESKVDWSEAASIRSAKLTLFPKDIAQVAGRRNVQ